MKRSVAASVNNNDVRRTEFSLLTRRHCRVENNSLICLSNGQEKRLNISRKNDHYTAVLRRDKGIKERYTGSGANEEGNTIKLDRNSVNSGKKHEEKSLRVMFRFNPLYEQVKSSKAIINIQ